MCEVTESCIVIMAEDEQYDGGGLGSRNLTLGQVDVSFYNIVQNQPFPCNMFIAHSTCALTFWVAK